MQEGLRTGDFLGRVGPAEFLLVLPGLSTFAVRAKVMKLMQIATETGRNKVSVLAAEAVAAEDGIDVDELLSAADRRIFELRTQRLALTAQNSSVGQPPELWVQ
jgi:GGDEF domain-containing protein